MLRGLKLSALRATRACGVFRLASRSRRRAEQLLILCYHGISLDDEHEWAPGLFMSAPHFEQRLKHLRDGGYTVLPLGEALTHLYAGTLPPRSVVITFDDGNHDFHQQAWPLLRAYGMPATVYLTTYYCERNLPIFPLMLSYLLWKARGREAKLTLAPGSRLALDARTAQSSRVAELALLAHAQDEGMSAIEKDKLAGAVASAFDFDYDTFKSRRLLHIMNAGEVRELAAAGVDIQLHTHRHRSPLDETLYRGELESNSALIEEMTGRVPRHFCYPSGTRKPQFERWIDDEGIWSATTCEPGIATRATHRLRLPRLLDHSALTPVEFDAWLCGLGAMLPHRAIGNQDVDRDGQLVIDRVTRPEATTAAR